jgi:hypothetical protein
MWSSDEEQNKSFSQVLTTEQSVLWSSDLKSSSTNQNDMLDQNDLKWFLIILDILHAQQNVKVKKLGAQGSSSSRASDYYHYYYFLNDS